jgi:inactive STAND
MAVEELDWQSFLELVTSRCQIKGKPKEAFMYKFASCDPALNPNGCSPVMPPESDPDNPLCRYFYRSHTRMMTEAYKNFEKGVGQKYPNKDKAIKVLDWLQNEYKKPEFITNRLVKSESNAQKLDYFLRTLDYLDQRQLLEKMIIGSEIKKIVLVQVDGEFTKQWLVKRLSLQVTDHEQSNGFAVNAQFNWNRDLKFFWESIYNHIKTPSSTPSDTIKELCDRCMCKPLIMVIHGIEILDDKTLRKIISAFWEPLFRELESQAWSDHGDCILFLTTDVNSDSSIERINSSYGIDLPPWTDVTGEHMKQWLKPQELKDLIIKCSNTTEYLLPNRTIGSDLLGSPEKMLITICKAVSIYKIAELEPYWKIAL